MTSREKVEHMIRHYQENLSEMRRLDMEIERHLPITQNELIDMLTFPGKREDQVLVQHTVDADKVMRVAMSYKTLCWQMNDQQRKEWTEEYGRYSRQVDFVGHAIRRLPRKLRELMVLLILEQKSWSFACDSLRISGATLSKLRSRAISGMAMTLEDYELVYMFREDEFGGVNDY